MDRHLTPQIDLEQYTIPADLAADLLFRACYEFGDIEGKFVLDLGTGTGRLAIGASILGAEYVIGVDFDKEALVTAARTGKRLAIGTDWVLADIQSLRAERTVDTVIMNPPFGTRHPHADLRFLQIALTLASVTYSIHKSATRRHMENWFHQHECKSQRIMSGKMEIPHQFPFHRKRVGYVEVDVFRTERNQDSSVSALK